MNSVRARLGKKLGAAAAVAIVMAMPLTTTTAFADDGSGSKTSLGISSFNARYQANAQLEVTLLQQAQSSSVTSTAIQQVSAEVQALNQQVNALYQTEQTLVAQMQTEQASDNPTNNPDQGQAAALLQERAQLIAQLKQLWGQGFGSGLWSHLGLGFGSNLNLGSLGLTGQSGLNLQGTGLGTWNTQGEESQHGNGVRRNTNKHGNKHGNAHGDRAQKKVAHTERSLRSTVHTLWHFESSGNLQQVNDLLMQILKIDFQLATQYHIQSSLGPAHKDDDHDADNVPNAYGGLKQLQQSILRLQSQTIADTRLWLTLEGQSAAGSGNGSGGGGVTSNTDKVGVTSSASTIPDGGQVVYTLQLQDAYGNSLPQAGVQINLWLVNGNNDGALSTANVNTNVNGQATVTVTAGSTPGNIELQAHVDGSNQANTYSGITQVVSPATLSTHLVIASQVPTVLQAGQTTSGSPITVVPENSANQVVSGDTLQVTTSNPAIVSMVGEASGSNSVQLSAGSYVLPVLQANTGGQATLTVTDLTAASHPTVSFTITVNAVTPQLSSAVVQSANVIVLTFNTSLNATHAPATTDFMVSWGAGSATPESAVVAGNTVTLTLWGTPLSHGEPVTVSYTAGTDANALVGVDGVRVGNYTNLSVTNGL